MIIDKTLFIGKVSKQGDRLFIEVPKNYRDEYNTKDLVYVNKKHKP